MSENNNKNQNLKDENQEMQNGSNSNNGDNNKMVEVEKKSAMPILSFGVSFVLLSVITRLNNPTKLILVLVLSFVVYQVVKAKFPPKKIELFMQEEAAAAANIDEDIIKENNKKNPELKNINERIGLYEIEIKLLNDSIGDEFIAGELREIGVSLKKIQSQINAENISNLPRKIEQLNDFFDYYMPTTIKILNSYKKIESQNLTGENAAATKRRVEETLPFIKKAFAKELDNMFTDEMLDITTDIDVLEAMLSKDGLIEKDGNNMRNFEDMV